MTISLSETGGLLAPAADRLRISQDALIDLLNTKHSDLRDKFNVELRQSVRYTTEQQTNRAAKTFGKKITETEAKFTEYEHKGFRVLIPHSVKINWLMPLTSFRMENYGLSEGRAAVVSSNLYAFNNYPTVVRDLNNKIYYGMMIEFGGLIGLESEPYEPLTFLPEEVEVIGKIIGYCEFNRITNVYEYYPLKM